MTDSEICREFLFSRNRKKQITILSERTLLPPERIREILLANRIEPDAVRAAMPAPPKTTQMAEHLLPAEIRKEVFDHDHHRSPERRAEWD